MDGSYCMNALTDSMNISISEKAEGVNSGIKERNVAVKSKGVWTASQFQMCFK